MSTNQLIPVSKLHLDLHNYRTMPQNSEIEAIHAMILTNSNFESILISLMDYGYMNVENIVVFKKGNKLIVKEGNQRIACLKLIWGIHDIKQFKKIPSAVVKRVVDFRKTDPEWFINNKDVPCLIYDKAEEAICLKTVSLIHGYNENAKRTKWDAIARSRHDRDENGNEHPALDLLEAYLSTCKEISEDVKVYWSAKYPLTVLSEGLNTISKRLEVTIDDLLSDYPSGFYSSMLDELINGIGNSQIETRNLRVPETINKILLKHGLLQIEDISTSFEQQDSTSGSGSSQKSGNVSQSDSRKESASKQDTTKTKTTNNSKSSKNPAYPSNDKRSVKARIRQFKPQGSNREKIALIVTEMYKLNIDNNPLAFMLLYRTLLDLSCRIYCKEANVEIKPKDKYGVIIQKTIAYLKENHEYYKDNKTKLVPVENRLTSNELFSIEHLHQLIHSPFSTANGNDVCILFNDTFELITAINS